MADKRTSSTDIKILTKRVQLLEMKLKELEKIEPREIDERLSTLENRIFVTKEMLTTEEVAAYLGISLSQIYKFTCNMVIPHYKPRGKMVYFDRKEIVKWMRKNHIRVPKGRDEEPTDSEQTPDQ